MYYLIHSIDRVSMIQVSQYNIVEEHHPIELLDQRVSDRRYTALHRQVLINHKSSIEASEHALLGL